MEKPGTGRAFLEAGLRLDRRVGDLARTSHIPQDQFRPPSSQTIRMIGRGMPINQSKSPRPIVAS
jgi:hypothetical protein